tara:strand:- start:4099 stop:4290 length:192 start_codon:yes stop_codon:yes gene_type:complete
MSAFLKYIHDLYLYPFGKPDDTIMCVNSFAKTDKRFNYIIQKSKPDEDEEMKDIEEYLNPINK